MAARPAAKGGIEGTCGSAFEGRAPTVLIRKGELKVKNRKTKQLIAATLALIFVLGIAAACGGSKADGNDGDDSGDGGPASTPVVTTPPPLMDDTYEVPEEVVDAIDWSEIDILEVATPYIFSTINFLYGYDRGLQKFNEEFGNIAVQLDARGVGGAEFTAGEDLITAVQSGDVWNLQTCANTKFPIMQCWYRVYTKIDKFIDWDNGFWKKPFMDDNFRWRGNYYGIASPDHVAKYFLSYNPKYFAEASIPTPRECYEAGDWNYAKILEYGPLFSATGDKYIVHYGRAEKGELWDATWYNHNQADDSLTPNFDTLATRDYFNFLEQMRDNGWMAYSAVDANSYVNVLDTFVTFFLADIDMKEKFKNNEIDIVPFPGKNGPAQPMMQVWHFMVPRGAKNVQASVLLGTYLCQGMADGVNEGIEEIGGDKAKWIKSIMPENPKGEFYAFPGVTDPYAMHNFTTYERAKTAAQFVSEWTEKIAGEIDVYNMTYLDGVIYEGDDEDDE